MTVLRNNKDSLLAVLEAFIYDPLLNWRLMEAKKSRPAQANAGAGAAAVLGTAESAMSNLTGGELDSIAAAAARGTTNVPHDHHLDGNQPEALNKKALDIVQRVKDKLTGRDFEQEVMLDVPHQGGQAHRTGYQQREPLSILYRLVPILVGKLAKSALRINICA